MKIEEPGHVYILDVIDEWSGRFGNPRSVEGKQNLNKLVFVNREPGHKHEGTQTQEVLRCLIDRTYHCHNCLPHYLNERIIYHLRMALVAHEMRALERKAEKGLYTPERVRTGDDGHFYLEPTVAAEGHALTQQFERLVPLPECEYREYDDDC